MARQASGIKLDAPRGFEMGAATVRIDGVEQVPTGNSTVPTFPKTINLPASLDSSLPTKQIGGNIPAGGLEEEYQLLGLGIRSVSFLSIQVYVVGLYIAKSDLAVLQQRLIRQAVVPPTSSSSVGGDGTVVATSLIPAEREKLKELLLDPERSEEAWSQVLKEEGLRTAFRIVPTRNTDFLHLRDGWVRGVTGRAQKANARAKEAAAKQKEGAPAMATESEFVDDSFGSAINDFKSLFGGGARKNVPKGQTLLLLRDRQGSLDALFQSGASGESTLWLGRVRDERISRLVWMGYLAGKNVASESARRSVVDGVMGIVERPMGTVAP
jgi:hypothetical protein